MLQATVLLVAFWIALVGPDVGALLIGIPAVVIAVWVGARLAPGPRPALRVVPAVRLGVHFVAMSFAGGVDVARRALRRYPRLAPAVIEVPIALAEPRARSLLASAVSLVPGTLCVDAREHSFSIHLLDASGPAQARAVAELRALERDTARLFRARPEESRG